MAQPLSPETQELLDAADLAIAHSRELADQRRQLIAECERNRRVQQVRLAFLREIRKPK
jgi:hypothetical protein